jgi:hypothetical protein
MERSKPRSRPPGPESRPRRPLHLRPVARLARRPGESFEGKVFGHLVWPPRGDNGFGYDPMFVPHGHEQTFGEMEPEAKHAMSHRAKAFEAGGRSRVMNLFVLSEVEGLVLRLRSARTTMAPPLHPLAVLRQQMPLLRLQQPRPRRAIDQQAWREALLADLAHEARCCPAAA